MRNSFQTPSGAALASGIRTRSNHIHHVLPPVSRPLTSNAEDDSLAGLGLLPSTVPETFQSEHAGVGTHPEGERSLRKTHSVEQKMSGGESPNDTQPLSQSFAEEYVRKSRSAASIALPQDDPPAIVDSHDTQMTVLEGDEDFVDICSSYQQVDQGNEENLNEADDSEPVTFSPTQTQLRMTQFPESQRFKTPATIPRRRDVGGYIVDSPTQPRNPLANTGEPTPARFLGLSQAFEATQAVSSPVANLALTQLRSDRPSPNFELQPRPTTAPASSPLRPLSEPKRVGSDPISHYVPVHHSQAARLSGIEPDETPSKNYESQVSVRDGFSDEPSLVARQRRAWEREERAREDLERASSPVSPVRPVTRSSATTITRPRSESAVLRSSPPLIVDTVAQLPTGNAQAADAAEHSAALTSNVDQRIPSRDVPKQVDDDTDTSGRIMHVPHTTKRDAGMRSGNASSAIDSPLIGRVKSRPTADASDEINSSANIRVANSQPLKSRITMEQPLMEEKDDEVERIPASQEQDASNLLHSNGGNLNLFTGSAVPETSSNERQEVNDPAPHTVRSGDTSLGAKPSTYRTAPTSLQPPLSSPSAGLDESSQPVRTTPPGRKRKRLTDVAQEPSPARNNSRENSFRASQVLALSQNPTTAEALASSPTRQRYSPRKRRRQNSQDELPVLEVNETKSSTEHTNSANIGRRIEDKATTEKTATPTDPPPCPEEGSTDPMQKGLEKTGFPHTPGKSFRTTSAWDLGPSPVQLKLPRNTNAMDQPAKKHIANGKLGTREAIPAAEQQPTRLPYQPAATAPTKLNDSPDPLAVSFVSTAPSKDSVLKSHVVAPQMVFACYFGKTRTYYPARCLGPDPSDDGRFKVQWKGYDPDSVDRHGICSLELRVGDLVKVDMDGFAKVPHVVRELKSKTTEPALTDLITDVFGHQTVVVAPKHRKSLTDELVKSQDTTVPMNAIYLDNNLWSKIKSRGLRLDLAHEGKTEPGASTPAIRPSTPTTPNSRSSKIQTLEDAHHVYYTSGLFANMAFALSFEASLRRDQIAQAIREHGGIVLEGSFADLFDDEFKIKSQFNTDNFCALLADKHSRKEKYMQALALGLPCLSGRWIDHSVQHQELVAWQDYLLPAGESTVLDGAVRSRILPYNATQQPSLTSMLQQRKDFFSQDDVVFLTGRGKAESKRVPYLFFVRAMGAGRIHKVPDLQAAEALLPGEESSGPRWLLVDEKEVDAAQQVLSASNEGKRKKRKRAQESRGFCKVVDTESIVQSLILGRWFDTFDI